MIEPLLASYKCVDHQAIAVQAAILEEVTYGRVVGTGAKEGFANAKKVFNWFTRKAAIKVTFDETPPPSTSEAVMRRAEHWATLAHGEVVEEVLARLGSMLQVSSTEIGRMSTRLIEEAAAGFEISDDLLLSQKADLVADAYMGQCLRGLRDQLKKQDPDEVQRTEASLAEQLASMSSAERLEIRRLSTWARYPGRVCER